MRYIHTVKLGWRDAILQTLVSAAFKIVSSQFKVFKPSKLNIGFTMYVLPSTPPPYFSDLKESWKSETGFLSIVWQNISICEITCQNILMHNKHSL